MKNNKLLWIIGIILVVILMQGKKEAVAESEITMATEVEIITLTPEVIDQKGGLVTCDDTDGGHDYYDFGTVDRAGVERSDYCLDGVTLIEYYCDGSLSIGSEQVTRGGYVCAAGQLKVLGCEDEDGGKDYYTKSAARYTVDGEPAPSIGGCIDVCDGTYNGNQAVRECFCTSSGDLATVRASRAGYICDGGKLVSESNPPTSDEDCGSIPCTMLGKGYCTSSDVACYCHPDGSWSKQKCDDFGKTCVEQDNVAWCGSSGDNGGGDNGGGDNGSSFDFNKYLPYIIGFFAVIIALKVVNK